MRFLQRGQMALPARTIGSTAARICWCARPYPRAARGAFGFIGVDL